MMNGYKKIKSEDYDNLSSKKGKYKIIYHYLNGNIKYEEYCIDNRYHREDGPAITSYYENGNIAYEGYYLCDKYFTKEYYSPKIQAILDIAKMMDNWEQRFNFLKLSLNK